MPNVSYKRKELKDVLKVYQMIQDCLKGEIRIKSKGTLYLPQPCPDDISEENKERYEAYTTRAVFYNVVKRTLVGLLGQIYAAEAVVDIDNSLEPLITDADGKGMTLINTSKKAAAFTLAFGRFGCFVDYPQTNGAVSKLDIDNGTIRPSIIIIPPWRVINWRTKKRGGKHVYSLIVIEEDYIKEDDGFEIIIGKQHRVLRLGVSKENNFPNLVLDNEDVYTVEVWREEDGNLGISEAYQPTDFNGNVLDEIPFKFGGVENNDEEIDDAPLYDLASLNIAHYRNSADFEESCYIVGQPTPWISGLTETWVNEILKGEIQLGSRAAIPLPPDASAGLIQADPNTMPKEAMEHKERQMVALGAKLVEQKTVQRTATEAGIDNTTENSTLGDTSINVSGVIEWALKTAMIYAGGSKEPKFVLNRDFQINNAKAVEIVASWQAGAISFTEMREGLKKVGQATQEDGIAKAEIEKDELAAMERMNAIGDNDEEDENQGGE